MFATSPLVVASSLVSSSPGSWPATWTTGLGAGSIRRDLGHSVEPLPRLDSILPEHIAYARSVVARFRVSPTHWRDDLVQEILIEAHRSRQSPQDVRALLSGITRHVVFRWRAQRDAERIVVALLSENGLLMASNANVEEQCQEAELRQVVRVAIDELPDLLREVFVRTGIEHMSMPEVVRDLGIHLNTGYSRQFQARMQFLKSLQRLLLRRRVEGGDLL